LLYRILNYWDRRMKCLEFLYFYLMDESPSTSSNAHVPSPPPQSTTHKPSLSTKLRVPSSPTKRAATPSSPTKTAPSTPVRPRFTHTPLRSQSNLKPFTPGSRPLRPSSSSSSALSNTWGSISSFSSGRSSSTTTTTPEPDDPRMTEAFPPGPQTPSKSTTTLADHKMTTNVGNGKLSLCPPIILPKDIDIDYVPISPKKTKFARIESLGTSGMAPKIRELKDLSTGSRSMPTLSNASVATSTKKPFGSYGHDTEPDECGKQDDLKYSRSRVRTAEEKKEILGGMLGNVEALVDGVRKAGIWGLG
jgi:Cell division control protein 14, SIN component